MTVEIPAIATEEREDFVSVSPCTQRVSSEGKILVSKKAWIARGSILLAMIVLMAYNLDQALVTRDPLIFYSTLMPTHTLAVFVIGWVYYRNKTNGSISEELVSVIIPVFNQESMIKTVIDAIFQSTYTQIEVIAVNDGSKDHTKEVLNLLAERYTRLRVLHKENGGKRTAVAIGFYASTGKYVVLIDSDSVVEKHAIEEFMKTFSSNPKVGGVVGNGRVWNADKNVLTRCQDAWYDYAFNIHKTTESVFGTVLCCSGCLAAYRREAIARFIPYWVQAHVQNSDDRDLTSYAIATPWAKEELSPLSQRLMQSMARYDDSEDRGLTAAALVEWKTVYVPTAVVYTEVPEKMRGYLRQQTRWKKGYIRSGFFVSAFFWRKNPLMSMIFYTEFMTTFLAPITIFAVYVYSPIFLQHYWIPITYLAGQLAIGLAAGLDYRLRDSTSRNWVYKPVMNLFASIALPWLIFPALWNFRKNRWLTR